MSTSIRNFFLTFLISLAIFGVIAFVILNQIGISSIAEGGSVVTGYDDYIEKDDGNNALLELDGNSFNMLFVGVDYAPKLFYDSYNPDTVKNLLPFSSDTVAGESVNDGEYRRISADTILLVCVSKERKEFAFTAFSPNTLIKDNGDTKCIGDIFEDQSFQLDGLGADFSPSDLGDSRKGTARVVVLQFPIDHLAQVGLLLPTRMSLAEMSRIMRLMRQ